MDTPTSELTTDITAALAAYGGSWKPRWPACKNAMDDAYGNAVAIHDQGDTLLVEFEYTLGGRVETLHLDPTTGARRIAAIIAALAAAPLENE
ncbi:hypothetical protein [Mycobacterium talmoniae]|uniref:Uncharacterized protein n=1 Tax=Mycobacterium talmoniae TaxID=1858794 RepID=A0A1S1NI29_9MYCO|nr:hypothetical protein [Mycobacterium talmoniae]OHV03721.1 hypothetical protein BKN37_13695 [Mycobacterium talmoniae]